MLIGIVPNEQIHKVRAETRIMFYLELSIWTVNRLVSHREEKSFAIIYLNLFTWPGLLSEASKDSPEFLWFYEGKGGKHAIAFFMEKFWLESVPTSPVDQVKPWNLIFEQLPYESKVLLFAPETWLQSCQACSIEKEKASFWITLIWDARQILFIWVCVRRTCLASSWLC